MGKSSVVCGLFKEFAQLNIPRAICTTVCSHENHSTTLLYIQQYTLYAGTSRKGRTAAKAMQSGVMDTTPSDKILLCLQQLTETRDYIRQKEHELQQKEVQFRLEMQQKEFDLKCAKSTHDQRVAASKEELAEEWGELEETKKRAEEIVIGDDKTHIVELNVGGDKFSIYGPTHSSAPGRLHLSASRAEIRSPAPPDHSRVHRSRQQTLSLHPQLHEAGRGGVSLHGAPQ